MMATSKHAHAHRAVPGRFACIAAAMVAAAFCLALCAPAQPAYAESSGSQDMYRLYNPNSGEHFYTASVEERQTLRAAGWRYESVGWVAPETSDAPVYRLYNPFAGDHHYTTSVDERESLVAAGWSYEGVGWYSDDAQSVPLFRQYNPNATAGTHNYTTSQDESAVLIAAGWRDEGTAWYAIEEGRAVADADQTPSANSGGSGTTQVDTVYVTKTGTRFHRASCATTSGHATTAMSRADALSRGLTACKVCRP